MMKELKPGILITIKDVQAFLCCGKAKAWCLVKDGYLTRVRFGTRMTRFRSDEVMRLMEHGQ